MNEHLYAYLRRQAYGILPGNSVPRTRDAQRAYIINAVQKFPEHNRRFIASCAWSALGYGGGL